MTTAENLKNIAERQRVLLADLEQEAQFLSENDLVKEKERLEIALAQIKEELAESQNKLSVANDENTVLKHTLYEQIYNDKMTILNHTAQKMTIYFRTNLADEQDELTKLKTTVTARIEKITKDLQAHRVDAQDELYQKLEEVTALLEEKLAHARLSQPTEPYTATEREAFQQLKEAPITDEQMKQLAKKNNLESLVGLNILNKLGVFLIIIGVIAASHYSYVRLSDVFKGIMMFTLGGAMLVSGEFLNSKKANTFSLGITAGGVAVLYTALSISYFRLEIVTQYPALTLCVLITTAAFLLSTRYSSQTILAFALIGGYLPIFSIGTNAILLYAAVIYFAALNLLALSVALRKKWTIASFIGLFLNMGGTAYICFRLYLQNMAFNQALSIGYVFFAFIVYTLIPILGTNKENGIFKRGDVVLIALNTLFSSLMMYRLFYSFDLGAYDGLLTICFALIYLLLGKLIDIKFPQEKPMQGLFYLTGFTFVVLTVPLQLGVVWLAMGWLIEGTALLVYGILGRETLFKRAGVIISGLCFCSFILLDVPDPWNNLFAYKYFALTLGSVVILSALIHTRTLNSQHQHLYKYGVLLNLWLYAQFVIQHHIGDFLFARIAESGANLSFLLTALAIVVTFLFAYSLVRARLLTDAIVKNISLVFYLLGILAWLFLLTDTTPFIGGITQTPGTAVLGTLLLLGISLLSLLALNETLRYLVLNNSLPMLFYPLILSGCFVVLLTQILVSQYQLAFSSAAISIIYVVTALMLIILGFMRRYAALRLFGLTLAILAVIKLFLVDLYSLAQGYKIVSYFALGLTLLIISFVYQYFNKRLASKEESVQDVQKNQ